MKKVLLITYYWPPAGGAGVQRWLKMSKYLPENGWEPVIYTAEPAQYISEDQSLLAEVNPDFEILKTPIWEPYQVYAKLTGSAKQKSNYGGLISNKKSSFAQKMGLFIRSNFFIPDARKWWIKPSINYLKKWLRENHVDAVISTGPPHSMHLIALGLKAEFPHLPWIADFRDPWTNIDFYKDLSLLPFADKKHHRLEKSVMSKADRVVAVTWDMGREFEEIVDRKIDIILNGYDPADFSEFKEKEVAANDKFIICHLGSMNKDRNPNALWQAISNLIQSNKALKEKLEIHLIGAVDISVNQSIEDFGLSECTKFIPFMPHDEAIRYLRNCAILLLSINDSPNSKGLLPTKLFEYMASQKPILAIGPSESDISRVLDKMNHCRLCGFEDVDGITRFISEVFRTPPVASSNISNYSRQMHAATFAKLLDDLLQA